MTSPSWSELESIRDLEGAEALARDKVIPLLEALPPQEDLSRDGAPKVLQGPMLQAFFLFIVVFMVVQFLLPDSFLGNALTFLLFPILFLGSIALMIYLNRDKIVDLLLKGQARFLAMAEAMKLVAGHCGLTYIPAPGGAPPSMKHIANSSLAPKRLKEIVDLLDDHGGLDREVKIARESGVMSQNVVVIASEEQKKKYDDLHTMAVSLEDGFQGNRSGMPFSAFEWIESVEDAPNIHHLVLVLNAPVRLHGLTQLRTRNTAWPRNGTELSLEPVNVLPRDFGDRFRLRGSDQTEARTVFNPAVIERTLALAHGEKFMAVAMNDHIVFDIAGGDRFSLVDLTTGEWDEARLRRSFKDLAELLDLVGEVGHAFMVGKDD